MYEWLKTKENDIRVNVYNTNSYDSIFKLWPGSGGIYKENEREIKQLVKQTTGREELDKLDKYMLLLWSVSVPKQMNSGGTT